MIARTLLRKEPLISILGRRIVGRLWRRPLSSSRKGTFLSIIRMMSMGKMDFDVYILYTLNQYHNE
jgi:hypothetical protein